MFGAGVNGETVIIGLGRAEVLNIKTAAQFLKHIIIQEHILLGAVLAPIIEGIPDVYGAIIL